VILRRVGWVILAGIARVIDTAGHVEHRGQSKTVCRLGHRRDVVYPKENTRFWSSRFSRWVRCHLEFPMGTFPAPKIFRFANRIISGISLGVWWWKRQNTSGTRITARCALEQQSRGFAVPWQRDYKGSWTPNTLIKQGANSVATWEDVWEELPTDVRLTLQPEGGNDRRPGKPHLIREK